MFNKKIILLSAILFLASILRFYKLSSNPPSLYWDEVSIGYNAYSISETGRDEYGQSFPLFFKSFGEYKLPLPIYLTSLSVKLLGPTPLAVRLPSALAGIITVLFTYLLVKRLFSVPSAPLLSALLLAISPWHLQFSRPSFESNFATLFLVLGTFLFIKAIESRRFFSWLFAGLCFVLSFYAYYTPRLLAPFIILALLFFYRRYIFPQLKTIFFSQIPSLILLIPLLLFMLQPESRARMRQVSILSQPLTNPIYPHRYLDYFHQFSRSYLQHFSPKFLFLPAGDANSRHAPRHTGLLFITTLPIIALGLRRLVSNSTSRPVLLITWLLAAPLAASLTINTPHALRSLPLIIPLVIAFALGIQALKKYPKLLIILCLTLSFELFIYLNDYYYLTPKLTASEWGDGYQQLVTYLKNDAPDHQEVWVTGKYWQPYIYFAFYQPFPPDEFQSQGSDHGRFDQFYFGLTSWDIQGKSFYQTITTAEDFASRPNSLIILPVGVDSELQLVKTISNSYQKPVFNVYRSL